MKAGDFVGWADTWSDEDGCDLAGIVLEREDLHVLILMQRNGKLSWEHDCDLVVMFESR